MKPPNKKLTPEAIQREIKCLSDNIIDNRGSMRRLSARKHQILVEVKGADGVIREYYRTSQDMKRYRTTLNNLLFQNAVMKKERALLERFLKSGIFDEKR